MKHIKQSIVVLYHAECRDGFAAAWVAWRIFKKKAVYIPVYHNAPIPDGIVGKTVYMLDFCYPMESLCALVKTNKRVIVLDHHITRKKEVLSLKEGVFSQKYSGASLAWRYFFPKKAVPFIIQLVQDADLYTWKIPHARSIIATIDSCPHTFYALDKILEDLKSSHGQKKYIVIGNGIEHYKQSMVTAAVLKADDVVFEGLRARAVNTTTQIASDVCNAFCRARGVSLGIAWRYESDRFMVSLRSRIGSAVDVARLAQRYGGGGHTHAAGFVINDTDIAKLPWKKVSHSCKTDRVKRISRSFLSASNGLQKKR